MKVWYLSAYDQPHGHSSRTFEFARELARRGHDVTMFTNSYSHFTHVERLRKGERWRLEAVDGISVAWLRTVHYRESGVRRGLNMVSNVARALQVSHSLPDRPDVVIGPSVPIGTGWAASRIAAVKQAAFVFEVRDVWPTALVELGALSERSPVYVLFRWLERHLYHRADRISSVLPFLADHVATSGSDPEKLVWIPNGLDLARFSKCPAYDGRISGEPVVMYVGGYGYAHDVITLVRAAALLEKSGTRCKFILVGNGIKRPECEREALRLGVSNVEFRDPVPKADVPRVLSEATIVVAAVTRSSIYRFGMNLNKIMDYFGSQRPVIFSGEAPNGPVTAARAGLSIPPEDPVAMAEAIGSLLAMSAAERVAIGSRGRRFAETYYDTKLLAGRFEQLLKDAVDNRREAVRTELAGDYA